MRVTHRGIVRTKMQRGPQLEADRLLALDDPIIHVNGILLMRQIDPFFERDSAGLVTPDRQAELQAERLQERNTRQVERAAAAFLTAEDDGGTVRETKQLGEVIEHHVP